MRRILIVFLIIAFGLIAAVLVIPALIPEDALRTRAEAAASEALGREVSLPGPISLRLLPSAEIRAGEARIANADGFDDEPFAEMAEMRVSVALTPLISRTIEVREFVLVDPTIRLQSRGGRNNWTFAAGEGSAAPAPAQGGSDGFQRAPGALPLEASFGDVRIVEGSVIYSDDSQTRRIEALNLTAQLPSLDETARLSGSFNADGQPMEFDLSLGSLRGFFEGAQTPFEAELTGALANIRFNGAFRESPDLAFDGAADITLPLRALGRYLGADLPEGDIFRRFTAEAQISGEPGRLVLSEADITFDDINASGGLTLNYAPVRPVITGSLSTPRLDVTPYIPAEDPQAAPAEGGVGPWSEDEIDLSPLRTVDADLTVRATAFKARDIEADDAIVELDLNDGRLVASISQVRLYGGRGVVTAVANARSARPSFSLDAEIETLQAQPFLTAAAGFERLAGVGTLTLDLAAAGDSPAAIMDSLSGQGAFAFEDGAITGVNLAQVIRTVQQGLQSGAIPSGFAEAQQTDFTALTGTIDIENGLARNLDLTMLSPLLRVEGTGSVNLAEQAIEYRLTPRAVQTLTGQGGDLDLQGVGVPVVIRGGFNAVSVSIDFASVARDIARARAGTLLGNQAGSALSQGGSLEDAARGALRDALGGGAREESEEEDPARRLLRGILGGSRPAEPAQDEDEGENGGEDGGEQEDDGGDGGSGGG